MRSNIVRIHRWNPKSNDKDKPRWVTQVIELTVAQVAQDHDNEFDDFEIVQGFLACAAENHDECRSQHDISEAEGYKVVQMSKGEIVRVLYDPNLGVLDIYSKPRKV